MAVGVEPIQERADAATRQSNTRIGGAVIKIDGVLIRANRVTAGKYDVLHISVAFIVRLGRKHPGIPANQALVRFLKVEQSQAEPIDREIGRASCRERV